MNNHAMVNIIRFSKYIWYHYLPKMGSNNCCRKKRHVVWQQWLQQSRLTIKSCITPHPRGCRNSLIKLQDSCNTIDKFTQEFIPKSSITLGENMLRPSSPSNSISRAAFHLSKSDPNSFLTQWSITGKSLPQWKVWGINARSNLSKIFS